MRNKEKKRKRLTKAKLIKGINGSISIFLCLLITPFLSLALGLVEYARYQEVIEVTNEIYELTGISVLSNYDNYIHNRFGLLATTQENELGGGADSMLEENIKLLGNQVKIENPTIKGSLPLTEPSVLRQQIVDFSELTVPAELVLKDFKVEELLEKLESVKIFGDIMNTVNNLADLTDSVSTAIDALKELRDAVDNLKTALTNAVSAANTLSEKMANLYKKLGENGITLPENATPEEIESAVSSFTDSYLDDFKALYKSANTVISRFNTIKTDLESVKTKAEAFKTALNNAKGKIDNISLSNSADKNGEKSSAAKSTLDEIINKMDELVTDTLNDIKGEAIETAKSTLDEIVNSTLENMGLAGVTTRYSEIVNGEYFALPLTDTAKNDIVDLLKTVQAVYSSNDSDALVSFFKSKFVPDIKIDIEDIYKDIVGKITEAENALKNKIGDKLKNLLTSLINICKKLFDLDLFYEGDLNAFVDIGNGQDVSGYQSFLSALGGMLTSATDFYDSIKSVNIFKALKAMKDMFVSIGKLLKSVMDIAGDMVASITELATSAFEGDIRTLYEKLLISGYMRHNLPCRLNSGEYDSDNFGNVLLNGTGITGFDYNDIARPTAYSGQTEENNSGASKFQGLATFLTNVMKGRGSDKMFKGAELEYICAGTNSELANQTIVFFNLYFLRLILDLPFVFASNEVRATAASATVAAWVVYILYIIAEPFCDTVLLVNNGVDGEGVKVPLIKTKCWLTASGLPSFVDKLSDACIGAADLKGDLQGYVNDYCNVKQDDIKDVGNISDIDYQTHVLILLLIFVESDDQLTRLANLIEAETTEYYRQQGKAFSMTRTYTMADISADATFNPFFDLGTYNGGSSLMPKKRIRYVVSY